MISTTILLFFNNKYCLLFIKVLMVTQIYYFKYFIEQTNL